MALFSDDVHTSTAKPTDVQLVKGPLVVSNAVHTSARHTLVYTLVKQAHFGVQGPVSHTSVQTTGTATVFLPPPLSLNCVTEEGPGVT